MLEKRIAAILEDLDNILPAGQSEFNDDLFCDLEEILNEMLNKICELEKELDMYKGE